MIPLVASCAGPPPGPTILEPMGDGQVEVVVDNRSDRPLAVDVSTPDRVAGILEARACEVTTMTVDIDPPFVIGFGPIGDRGGRPMPAVIGSDDLAAVDGAYKALVTVDPDGSVSADNLTVSGIAGPAGECEGNGG